MEELNAIYERMRAIFAEEAGFVPNDGCDAMVRLYALASEVQSLLAQADWVLDQSFPQTAVGQYLDYHAETRALTRLPAAKAAFYEQEAMSFPNVAAAKAVGRARGIGTVDVYVSTHAGAPDEKLLGEIEAVLQKKREIAVDVEVKAPTEKTVNMSAELTAEQGWTMQEITDAATAALQAYFTGERLGEAVYTAKLASILYGVEGVKNCHLLTPDEDVSVSATELPVLGTVTITEIGAGEA